MKSSLGVLFALAVFAANGLAQPYIISTIAGTNRVLDGNPATSVPLRDPRSVAADAAGGIYIADGLDNRIRRITPQGLISTIAGNGVGGYTGDNGQATAAEIYDPHTVALDAAGNIYIADYGNHVIRHITPSGVISTVAGSGDPTFAGNGAALKTGFSPQSIAVDPKGAAIYIADDSTFHILKMDIASGNITAIAGTGTAADYTVTDTGPGLTCRVGVVADMALDSSGNLYLADLSDARVRKIDTSGNLTRSPAQAVMAWSGMVSLPSRSSYCLWASGSIQTAIS